MPIVYEDIVRGRQRGAFELPSSRGEALTETFAQAYEENPVAAVRRMLELREDERTGPRISAEQARARLADAGMESDIEVSDAGITEAALATLMDRKRIERRRQETFAMSGGGLGEGLSRLGVAAVTSLADPVSAIVNFVPVAGQARYARMLGSAGGVLGRTGVRVGVGAAEGAAGAAMLEPLIYAMRTQEQADYDAVDSLLNVALGGVVGSGLHTTVGSLGDLYVSRTGGTPYYERYRGLTQEEASSVMRLQEQLRSKALDLSGAREQVAGWSDAARRAVDDLVPPTLEERIARLPPQDREVLLRKSVNQAAAGDPVNVKTELDDAEYRLIEREVDERLDAREAELRRTTEAPNAEADRLTRTYGDTDTALQAAKRERDEAAAVLSQDEARQVAEEAQRLARDDSANRYAQDRTRETGGGEGVVFPAIQRQAEENVSRQRAFAREQLDRANALVNELQSRLDTANRIRGAEVDIEALRNARGMAANLRERIELLPDGLRQQYLRRLDAAEAERAAARAAGAAVVEPRANAEHAAASAAADQALKSAPPDAPDALSAALDELAGEAEAEARQLAERLGIDLKDADLAEVAEAAMKAERWARAAELATVCLVRGG